MIYHDLPTKNGDNPVCKLVITSWFLGGILGIHLPRRIQGLGQSTYRRAPGDTWGTAQGIPRGFKHVPCEKYQKKHLVIEKNIEKSWKIYFGLTQHLICLGKKIPLNFSIPHPIIKNPCYIRMKYPMWLDESYPIKYSQCKMFG